jgi:hypothetical protein
MIARMYRIVDVLDVKQKEYLSGLRGQAKIVAAELLADRTPRLATEINAKCEKHFVTRQDPLRVTLYYVIIFKKRGIVVTSEPKNELLSILESDGSNDEE